MTNFHDPIAAKALKKEKSPWDYTQPKYDERSSCYVNAGSHYGIGYKNPVGHEDNPKMRVPTLPYGRIPTLETDQIPRKNLSPEMEE